MVRSPFFALFLLPLLAGCETAEVTTTAAAAQTTADSAQTGAAAPASQAGGCGEEAAGEGSGCGGRCGGATSEIEYAGVETRTLEDGTQVTHAGAALAGLDEVALPALLDNPTAYRGKRIRVRGDVSAMCHHERAWFSLVAGDKTGRHVRVFTAPRFLVPHGSIGRAAVTEGIVDVIEIPAERARHMAKEHKLADPADIQGPVLQVIIRASGADFS
jgi:hypothetical protein